MATDDLILKSLNRVKAVEDEYILRLDKVLRDVDRQLSSLLGSQDYVRTADLAIVRADIQNILVKSGYYETTQNLLTTGYQEILKESIDMYNKMVPDALQFGEKSIAQLEALRSIDLSQFESIPETKINDITKSFTQLQFGTITKSQAIEMMAKEIDVLKNQANTLVTTGTSAIYRTSNYLAGKELGLTKYKYYGPLDKVTRPWCREHVGQVHTEEEWNQLGASNPLQPTMSFGGGFNCRHSMVAVI